MIILVKMWTIFIFKQYNLTVVTIIFYKEYAMEKGWKLYYGLTILGIVADILWLAISLIIMLVEKKFDFYLFLGLTIGLVYLISHAIFIRSVKDKLNELSDDLEKKDNQIIKIKNNIDSVESTLYK